MYPSFSSLFLNFFYFKPLQTRDLSVLEKEAFERAKIRHKENIVQPQVVQGKTFKGVAFISKPEKIIFKVTLKFFSKKLNVSFKKDFNLGEPVSQTIYLTNVSFTFNSFKLMPMKESIKVHCQNILTIPPKLFF